MDELEAIANEFRRYRALGEKSMQRLDESALNRVMAGDLNSVATIARHIGGNLRSRFTNFLTEDGEKEWRDRDAEFEAVRYGKPDITAIWAEGWDVLEGALANLSAEDLDRTVSIRGVPLSVHEALARSATHVAYHVGQIVLLARLFTPPGQWESLSIPRGQSASYNAAPVREKKP